MTKSKKVFIASVYLTILLSELFLLFFNLDSHLLWGDEAETAVLAKNVVKYGVPKTDDGINHITLYGSNVDSNASNIWTWSPWLQEYITAASYKLLGATTRASRVPFAIIGWLCLVLLGFVAHRIYRNHWITVGGLLLLGTSEIFLLHARQCRYYSISVLGEILLIYAIYQLLAQNKTGAWLLALSLTLQFYSNYIIAAANLPLLAVLAWTLYRRDKKHAFWIVVGLGIFLVTALPWWFYARPWQQLGLIADAETYPVKLGRYLREFHFHFLPWIFLLLPVGGWLRTRLSQNRQCSDPTESPPQDSIGHAGVIRTWEWHLFLLLPLYLVMILIPPGSFARYELPLLPVACLLGSAWVFRYIKWRALALALVLFQCTNNSLSIATGLPFKRQHTFRWPLFEFSKSILHSYQDRLSDVLEFLNKETKPGQTVLVFDPEFPLVFYTQLKVINGRLASEYALASLPDWVLSESPSGVFNKKVSLPDSFSPYFETLVILVHDSAHGGGVPQPDVYEYETVQTLSPFTLYKKRGLPP